MMNFFDFLFGTVREISWIDFIDILLVSFLFYKLFQLIRGGRAVQMVVGTLLLGLLFFASRWAELRTLNWLLRNALAYVGLAIIVLYQQELRRGLANLGQAPLFRFLNPSSNESTIEELLLSIRILSKQKIGAIIVLERDIGLKNYMEGGILLDATVTSDLIISIFNPKSPLHDGAVIIQRNRTAAAACFLPISINPQLSKELGTRHRAALGITEDTDAIAIVVSEETGMVSFVAGGNLTTGLDSNQMRSTLQTAMGQTNNHSEQIANDSMTATNERSIP